MAAAVPTYPVRVELDAPLEVARWRPVVHWLLAIPHLIVVEVLQTVQQVLAVIAFFTILFTGRIPPGLFGFMAMVSRYSWRTYTYVVWMREPYPAFEFEPAAEDPGTDPARYSIEYPERFSRGLIFVKWLLAFPHYIVLFFLVIAALAVAIVAWFAVLFTGRWPAGMRNFLLGVGRWSFRVGAYVLLMTDVYPPFSLR